MQPTPTRLDSAADAMSGANETLLQVRDVKTHFFTDEGVVKAVDGVNLSLKRGQTLCVVGESGCGKSVTARSILRIVPAPGRIVSGEINFQQRNGAMINLAQTNPKGRAIRHIRGREISMIFQEPMSSLSPVHTIGSQIMEAILLHLPVTRQEARKRAVSMLELVGIPRAGEQLDAYSFELSGGMRQRAMIAIALACEPQLLIADEPTTALDVTTQANILDLIRDLQQASGMSVLFITHDLGVVAEIADEVVVMYLGRDVESGPVDAIFHDPKHPYTRALLQSIPRYGSRDRDRLYSLKGTVPHPFDRPSGCPFHPRCDEFIQERCNTVDPDRYAAGSAQSVRCLLYSPDADQYAKEDSKP
ncbi:MAG: ABC transporter ATP-binding protein [Chloroflexota bacterium]|nr:ABC transporter ATP-binding protein [Chloroflexota bacterium]